MPHYKKVFASREEAMQEKASKSLPNLHQLNAETIFYQQDLDETYYPAGDFIEFTYTITDIFEEILEEHDHVKIYRLITVPNYDRNYAPIDHNYNTGLTTTLFPKRDFFHGELQRVRWYADKEQTDLMIDVVITYQRDALGFPIERTTTRTWIREDGSAAMPNKITFKEYHNDAILQLTEGVKRRGNLRTNLIANVMGMMMAIVPALDGETEPERQSRIVLLGRNFLALYKKEFNDFVDDSNKAIITLVTQAQDFWLELPNPLAPTTTIRDYVISELSSI